MLETETIHDLLERWGAWARSGRTVAPSMSFVRLDSIVRCLPPWERCVLMRRCVHRQAMPEIAQVLVCSTRTAERTYADAVEAVAGKLGAKRCVVSAGQRQTPPAL